MTEEKRKTVRIRIQSDGGVGHSTKITDAETGKEIERVGALSWSFDCNNGSYFRDMPIVVLTVFDPVVDIVADAEVRHICPACGRENEVPREYQENKTVPLSVRVSEEIGKAFSWLDKHGDLTHD